MTLLSRVLGFVRDSILARTFGASISSDAFFVAFKIPNLLRRIFAEGAFSQAFVPILMEYKNQQGIIKTRKFISHTAGLLILVLFLITIIAVITAPWIVVMIAPGFANIPNKFILTIELLRITFPYILLISLTSLVGAILNAWSKFTVPAFAPTILNFSMIGFMLFTTPLFNPPVMALAWAVIVGGIFQLGYQIPHLKKIEMLVLPKIQFKDNGVCNVIKKMVPAIFGVSVNQISLVINTVFTSFLTSGSVSWMYYADRLMEFPAGVLGVALGTILLPSLSRSIASSNYYEYSQLMDWGLRLSFIMSIPSAIILGTLAHPLTVVLFKYGEFSDFDVCMTQHMLVAYSISLVGIIIIKVLAPGFYSCRDIKTPIRIAVITLIITQLMNIIFVCSLNLECIGLSISINLAVYLNSGMLYWQLRRKNFFKYQPGWINFLFRLIIAAAIMATVLLGLLSNLSENNWTDGSTLCRLLHLIYVILVGIFVYFIILWLFGMRPSQFMRLTQAH